MDADPQGGPQGPLAHEDLGARIARLEAEVGTLRVELAALRSELPLPASEPGRREAISSPAQQRITASPPQTFPAPALHPSVDGVTVSDGLAQEPVPWEPVPLAIAAAPPGLQAIARPQAVARPRALSLESRLGSAVLSKVAVVLLLLGVAWFLKWAFDNRWIGPAGRIGAGLAAGVGVIWWSERFRRQQLAAFSYALKAVGSGVLYLSVWASVHLYHVAPAPLAFACMLGVTAWNAAMAWRQDAQLLAGYALLGAYLTPLLLRTGANHEVFLFSYLLAIALALLGLLRAKAWSPLHLGVIAATAAIFVAWFVAFFDAAQMARTALFILLLWAVLALVPLLAAGQEDGISAVLGPAAAAGFGGVALYAVLADSGARQWELWGAVGFAAAYLAFVGYLALASHRAFTRTLRARSTGAAVHLTLAVAFITVAIPLKATGRTILCGWLLEAIVLMASSTLSSATTTSSTPESSVTANSTLASSPLWAGARKIRTVLRVLASAVGLLATGGVLLQPWIFADAGQGTLNADFTTSLGAAAALAILLALTRRMRGDRSAEAVERWTAAGSLILLNLVLLVAGHRELRLLAVAPHSVQPNMQSSPRPWNQTRTPVDFAFSAWMMVQGAVMLAAGFWRRVALARWIGLALLVATVIKTFAYDMRELGAGYRVVSYLGLGVLLMGVSFAYQKDWLGRLATDAANRGDKPGGEVKA